MPKPKCKTAISYAKRRFLWVVFCFLISFFSYSDAFAGSADKENIRWAVYYGDDLPQEAFYNFDLVVFDRDAHPPIQELQARGKLVFGYVSAAEAEKDRQGFINIKKSGILLQENPNWPNSYFVDIREPAWQKHIINEVVPSIVQSGFQGVFIDTLDNAEYLESSDPVKYRGMKEAAVKLVNSVHIAYPNLQIIINRGFEIMPYIVNNVDYLLAEGILVNYDFKSRGNNSKLFDDYIYQEYVDKIHALKEQSPKLKLLSLDYWDMTDTEMVKQIYRRQRSNGFNPYVTTIELNKISAEP